MKNLLLLSLIFIQTVKCQVPWSFTEFTYGQAATGSPAGQIYSMRTYRNILISLRMDTGTGAAVCNYYNGASTNCIYLNTVFNTVEFFSEGGPSDPIYFLVTIHAPTTEGVLLYQASATTTSVSANVKWNSATDGYAGILGVNIDYQHRWMVLLTTSTLHVFDIRTITKPVRTDVVNLANNIGTFTHPRCASIYKNRVCTCTAQKNKGIQCYSVRQGKITSGALTADTNLGTRAIRVFDDFIIASILSGASALGILYNSSTLEKLGTISATITQGPLDFLRSNSTVIFACAIDQKFLTFDIFNPKNPIPLIQQSSSRQPLALFMDSNAIYVAQGTANSNLGILGNMIIPGGFQSFYEKSEWYNYGNGINTLSAAQSASFIMYYGNTTLTLPILVTDTYLPNDVNITYTVVSRPMNDFALEIKSGNTWFNMTLGSTFTQNMLQAGQVRVRDLNLPNPLSRSLNQTTLLLSDNGRNSRLNITLTVTRTYGPACPIGATCTNTAFECMAGYSINSNEDGCTPCSIGSYKSISGNAACTSCPSNSECPGTGMSLFSCLAGFTISGDYLSCVTCSAGQYKSSPGNGPCTTCPSNADCTVIPYTNFMCRPGLTISGDSLSCVSCSAGQYKSSPGNGPCTTCPSNADCTVIPYTNFMCRPGFTISGDSLSCVSCPVNSFKEISGNSACLPCPPNADCSTGTKFICAPSFFWNSAENACQKDPVLLTSSRIPLTTKVPSPPLAPASTNILTMILSNPLYLGLSIGALALILLISIAIAYVCWRRRKQSQSNNKSFLNTTSNGTTSIFSDTTTATANSANRSLYSKNGSSRYSTDVRNSYSRRQSSPSKHHGARHHSDRRPLNVSGRLKS